MLEQSARVLCAFLCLGGFLLQISELFGQFIAGTTTITKSSIPPENGRLNLPRFSVCLNPPTTVARLSELGLSPMSWNIKQLRLDYDGNVSWPITSENNTNLYDRSMFSFDEVFEKVKCSNRTLTVKDTQYYKVMNTISMGKCFTFLTDEMSAGRDFTVTLKMKNVFRNQSGRFKIYLHDQGMELLLVNQGWPGTKKYVQDVSPGTFVDIMMKKNIFKKLPKLNDADPGCRKDWSSMDYFECIGEYMENITTNFSCRSPFDMSLNQSAIADRKPICTSFNDTKSIFLSQRQAFWSKSFSDKCPQYCNIVSYSATTSDVNLFGSDETIVYLIYESLVTTMEEEVLVYGVISMISAIGGSLGLFLGFSFLDVGFKLIHVLREHLPGK